MNTNAPKPDPGADAPPNMHEADIGSGERSPAQHETDAMIREIPSRGAGPGNGQDAGQSGQSGNQQSSGNPSAKE